MKKIFLNISYFCIFPFDKNYFLLFFIFHSLFIDHSSAIHMLFIGYLWVGPHKITPIDRGITFIYFWGSLGCIKTIKKIFFIIFSVFLLVYYIYYM